MYYYPKLIETSKGNQMFNKPSQETILNGLRDDFEEALEDGELNEKLGAFIVEEAAYNWTKARIINTLADELANKQYAFDHAVREEDQALEKAGLI